MSVLSTMQTSYSNQNKQQRSNSMSGVRVWPKVVVLLNINDSAQSLLTYSLHV